MDKYDRVELVRDVPEEAILLTDSQDTEPIRESYPELAGDLDGFFVIVGDGEYDAVWGFSGIIPYLDKPVWRVV